MGMLQIFCACGDQCLLRLYKSMQELNTIILTKEKA
jgi:hypothetical protein